MNYQKTITHMPESVYLQLKEASETGKWPNGALLTDAQKQHCLQAVLAWQAIHIEDKQHFMPTPSGDLTHKNRHELETQYQDQQDIIPTRRS